MTKPDIVIAGLVLAGVGAEPETGLAEAAGLAIENGVAVDRRLRTSDPFIFAAGDCASFPHPLFGGRRLRLEAWRNAQDQGGHCHVNSNWPREVRTTQFEFMRLSQLATSVKLLLGRRGACGGM